MRYLFIFILTGALLASCQTSDSGDTISDNHTATTDSVKQVHPIVGGWRVTGLRFEQADTTVTVDNPSPGVFMFSESMYSASWSPQTSRKPFADKDNPTDDEIKAAFNSIIVNAGTYTVNDSLITTTPEVARVPGFEGGGYVYKYTIEGDKCEFMIYDEYYPDGTRPEWLDLFKVYVNLERE